MSVDSDLANAMTGNLADLAKAFQGSAPTSTDSSSASSPVAPSPTLTGKLQPTVTPTPALGFSRSRPAPLGTSIRSTWRERDVERSATITVKETVRGDEAWTRIKAANQFNSASGTGEEYVLVRVDFKYETGPVDTALSVGQSSFIAISAQGKEYGQAPVVTPKPELDTKLYPGASNEGWVAFLVATDDPAPLVAYGRSYDGSCVC